MRLLFFLIVSCSAMGQAYPTDALKLDIKIGVFERGEFNAITDIEGLSVGHFTKIEEDSIRTGATAVIPHSNNIYKNKVPAAIFVGNGYGKLAGYTQVKELGNIETPIILTNTLSIAAGLDALIDYTASFEENKNIRSVNGIVGETNDGYLNDILGRHVSSDDIKKSLKASTGGTIQQGNVGAGTGTICFGWKGGIGSSSRVLPQALGGYTVGVLVQTNFGGILKIAGKEIGQELDQYKFKNILEPYTDDGSCMIVVATDAPLDARNLERLAKRAFLGLGRTGGIADHGSGDYVIAFSTNESVRVSPVEGNLRTVTLLKDERMGGLFEAAIEATEEAIINSLFAAETMTGQKRRTIYELPEKEVLKLLKNE